MELLTCMRCGASDFYEQDGYRICYYCRSQHVIESAGTQSFESIIALDDDVERLLQQCRNDPAHAQRYASLALDIDPANAEAKSYFSGK